MRAMRRQDRQITDSAEILAILKAQKVCRLAMMDAEGLYLVPLNFGYALHAQQKEDAAERTHTTQGLSQGLTLYFHSASAGRKIDALQSNPQVCFELDGAHALIPGELLTDYTYHYDSIIGSGKVRFITDEAERMDAMAALIHQQTGMTREEMIAMPREEKWMKPAVMAVFAVEVETISAKRHG